mgnify:CR=1
MQVHFVDTLRVDFVELLIGGGTTLIVDLASVSLVKQNESSILFKKESELKIKIYN